ncbi:hypothetical protein TNCV_2972611 [Trichonephila clavipes]|nr:hypothetical protein TNCV_2972611 [Trichonephila clavipes]
MVKVSDHGRHVMSSSPVPLRTHRVGQRCTLNLSRDETSSRWCGDVVRRGSASSGPLRGRICGGRVVCVVGDSSKERSAESDPGGRGTWLRMARRRGLAHIEKSSLALALDHARQHVMSVSPLFSFEESSGGYT